MSPLRSDVVLAVGDVGAELSSLTIIGFPIGILAYLPQRRLDGLAPAPLRLSEDCRHSSRVMVSNCASVPRLRPLTHLEIGP